MAEKDDAGQEPPSAAEQPSPPPYETSEEPRQAETSRDARNMAMLCHVLGITGFFAPLIIWLIERDKHRFVDEHGREAMNYQISLLIYSAVASLLAFVYIGLVLMPALMLVHLALSITGALRARQGEPWHYPIAITFLA